MTHNMNDFIAIDSTLIPERVIASIIVSCLSSFTALYLNNRRGQPSFISDKIWLIMAAIAMSLGIWSMHFIGMAAVKLPGTMTLDYAQTVVSLFPPIISSYVAFYIVTRRRVTNRSIFIASLLMGTGIIMMHYIGMNAMTYSNISYTYNWFLVGCSIMIAIAASYVALYIIHHAIMTATTIRKEVSAAILLGVATSSVHYIGIMAMNFRQHGQTAVFHEHGHDAIMTTAVTISVLCLFALLIGGSVLDKWVSNHFKLIDSLTKLPNRYSFIRLLSGQEKVKSVAMFSIRDLHLANHEYSFIIEDEFIETILTELQDELPPLVDMYRIREHYFVYVIKDDKAASEMNRYFERKMIRLKTTIAKFPQEVSCKVIVCIDVADTLATVRELYSNVMTVEKHPSTELEYGIVRYQKGYHTRNFSEQLLADLNQSLEKNELFIVYQPKVCPAQQKVLSAEALIRWDHAEFGFVSPAVFVPILEANNRMNEVTNWVINQVCKQLAEWGHLAHMPKSVSINIPAPYLSSPLLKDQLLQSVKNYGVSPSQIELEVTETSFVSSIEQAKKAIEELRHAGFSLAIDDFGIGVSSLAYLKEFKFTTLKVDKAFVDHVPHSSKDNFILQSILSLGESLNMMLIVEGVETKVQVDFLRSIQSNIIIQSYYYSKPLPNNELESWCLQFANDVQYQN